MPRSNLHYSTRREVMGGRTPSEKWPGRVGWDVDLSCGHTVYRPGHGSKNFTYCELCAVALVGKLAVEKPLE